MKPLVAIVGRENVGKSTLFNRLIGKNKAVIDDLPGLTRDRNYAEVSSGGKEFILVDTGGFEPLREDSITSQIREQTQLAIEEADTIIFLADGQAGLNPTDIEIVRMLEVTGKPLLVAVNKIDGPKQKDYTAEFFQLGVERLIPISAKNNLGIPPLKEDLLNTLPQVPTEEPSDSFVKIALVGRPNVGKSSLINKIVGNKRLLTDWSPGTTRDAIDTTFTYNGQNYLLIDTAGIRRKSRVSITFEKYCIIEALKSLDRCDVGILLIDVIEGVTQQDARIAHFIYTKGKGCIIAVNKWDLIEKDNTTHKSYLEKIRYELRFLDFAPVIFISALTGQRTLPLLESAAKIFTQSQKRILTNELNTLLNQSVQKHPPPYVRNKQLKFYYATQIDVAPPHIVVFTN
ncbi:MAG: ribosome biogenesis GTPase Der, partial [Thermodesulfobacteriota bacterium]|nr:ribosome biogenesis GTPase Der [Thermodesulfobacteriota bacterium]